LFTSDDLLGNTGAKLIQYTNELPEIKDAMVRRAIIRKLRENYIISLVTRNRVSARLQIEYLKKTIGCLFEITQELQLKSFSISKRPIVDLPWDTNWNLLTREFRDISIKINMCTNEITTPPKAERFSIISENHISAMDGHKGITKILKMLKLRIDIDDPG